MQRFVGFFLPTREVTFRGPDLRQCFLKIIERICDVECVRAVANRKSLCQNNCQTTLEI